MSRYLTLSDIEPTRYRKAEEYVEHFRALFDTAVAERIQSPSVGVLMSGGLDSTSVAVTAHRLLQTQPAAGLQLWTIDPGELIENDERDHADLVSRTLGVPHYYLREEEYRIYERYQTAGQGPASVEGPFAATIPQPLQRMAPECRVALMGHNENVLHFRAGIRPGSAQVPSDCGIAGKFPAVPPDAPTPPATGVTARDREKACLSPGLETKISLLVESRF